MNHNGSHSINIDQKPTNSTIISCCRTFQFCMVYSSAFFYSSFHFCCGFLPESHSHRLSVFFTVLRMIQYSEIIHLNLFYPGDEYFCVNKSTLNPFRSVDKLCITFMWISNVNSCLEIWYANDITATIKYYLQNSKFNK